MVAWYSRERSSLSSAINSLRVTFATLSVPKSLFDAVFSPRNSFRVIVATSESESLFAMLFSPRNGNQVGSTYNHAIEHFMFQRTFVSSEIHGRAYNHNLN